MLIELTVLAALYFKFKLIRIYDYDSKLNNMRRSHISYYQDQRPAQFLLISGH